MIEQFMNPYYQNVDSLSNELIASPFQYMWKKYFEATDGCIMASFKKLYSAEVFGSDSKSYLENLNVIKMTFFQYLFMKEEIEMDKLNNDVKSIDFYMDKYNLNCENIKKKLLCISCNDHVINDAMFNELEYQFNDEFSNDFN